jgi:hypothetical protein
MYKLAKPTLEKNEPDCVFRLSDSACIPFDPDNKDYENYLKWVAEGNTPLPAEE